MTKQQKKREKFAVLFDKIAGTKSESGKQLRRINRIVEMKKGGSR